MAAHKYMVEIGLAAMLAGKRGRQVSHRGLRVHATCMEISLPTLARGDITRSTKQGLHKKDLCLPKIYKKNKKSLK